MGRADDDQIDAQVSAALASGTAPTTGQSG